MAGAEFAGKQVENRVNLLDPLRSLRNDRAQVPDRLWLTIRFNKPPCAVWVLVWVPLTAAAKWKRSCRTV
jgi:hypothetical protein